LGDGYEGTYVPVRRNRLSIGWIVGADHSGCVRRAPDGVQRVESRPKKSPGG